MEFTRWSSVGGIFPLCTGKHRVQYFGAALSLYLTGRILKATQAEHGYTYWFAEMAAFGILGGLAMWMVTRKQKRMAAAAARAA